MKLSVASSGQLDIDIIGSIKLKTHFRTLIVRNVLYCEAIPGTVLLIGQLLTQDINVKFLGEFFILTDEKRKFVSNRRNFRWSLEHKEKVADIEPVTADTSVPPVNFST
ncbi:hypothetical protein O181_130203 [Austropuccinia psidii MF-1]|uniref:Uncharacterized protein n=1 Tax=Austropuccinia psidii MF-1 TaxID=1389203 RepID=A0A9Q3KY68_9BASI|nr:hypothetical protein [Austropuccinia psidii MF-1]